jgi:hypothetical protein
MAKKAKKKKSAKKKAGKRPARKTGFMAKLKGMFGL